jgi:replicative DNA helicase
MGEKSKINGESSKLSIPIREALDQTFAEMDKFSSDFKDPFPIDRGYTFLNQMLIGSDRPRLTIISAPASVGTGYLGASIIADLALNNKRSLGCFSLETSNTYFVSKLISVVADIDLALMRSGRLPSDQWPTISSVVRDIADTKIFFDDTRPFSVKTFRLEALALMKESNIDLFVIDSLQYISCKKYHKNKARNLQKICQSLKDISDELNVSILLMSQFSDKYDPDDIDVTNACGSLVFLQDFEKIPDAELCLIPGKQDREDRFFSLHICRNREGVTGTIDLKQNINGGGFEQYWE